MNYPLITFKCDISSSITNLSIFNFFLRFGVSGFILLAYWIRQILPWNYLAIKLQMGASVASATWKEKMEKQVYSSLERNHSIGLSSEIGKPSRAYRFSMRFEWLNRRITDTFTNKKSLYYIKERENVFWRIAAFNNFIYPFLNFCK